MDLLRKELERKRKSLQDDFGGKKIIRRSEIEQKHIEKLRLEEQRELEAKSLLRHRTGNDGEDTSSPSSSSDARFEGRTTNPNSSSPSASAKPTGKKSQEQLTDEQKIDELVLSKQEVIRRLRFFKQPITLFGEDDDARLDRLKLLLKAGILEVENEMTEGQTNDFLRDIAELRKRQKTGMLHHKTSKEKDAMEDGEEDDEGDGGQSGEGGSSGVDVDKDLKRMKANFEDLCDEDKILVFFKRLLHEWNQELEQRPESEKRTAKGKSMVATFKQCARYLNPLFKFCRKRIPTKMAQVCSRMEHSYLLMLSANPRMWPSVCPLVRRNEISLNLKVHSKCSKLIPI
ncbi:unnamed protein product [Victoria cruziana]